MSDSARSIHAIIHPSRWSVYFDRDADGVRECEPWDHVVADARPCDHIVQLYQDEDFLNRAVCRFAGAALANGEGIILVPTLAHWNAIGPRLEAEGVDVAAARKRGQLTDRKSVV